MALDSSQARSRRSAELATLEHTSDAARSLPSHGAEWEAAIEEQRIAWPFGPYRSDQRCHAVETAKSSVGPGQGDEILAGQGIGLG